MAQNVVRKLIESGMHFTEDSQAKAEKLVKDLVKAGEVRRKDILKLGERPFHAPNSSKFT